MKIGVLAMQGAFIEHINAFKKLGVEVMPVRYEDDIDEIDGLVIPGGESTAMGKLMSEGFKNRLKNKIVSGLPTWGTCAGMIILAKEIEGFDITHIPVMDIKVERNAYGRQLGSFTVNSKLEGIEEEIPMVFIRAPYIMKAGENVSVLSKVNDKIVAARQDNMLVTSFHPELTADLRMHDYFVNMIKN